MKASAEQLCMKRTPMALISFNYKVKEAFITGREGKTRPLKGKQWHKACLPYPKQAHVQRGHIFTSAITEMISNSSQI